MPEVKAEEVLIVLDLPPRALSQNVRCNPYKRTRLTRQYRKQACAAAVIARACDRWWKSARAQATFYWREPARRDIRNAEAMLKPAYDGLVDVGLIVDDRAEVLRHDETVFKVDPKCPRVEIRVRRTP